MRSERIGDPLPASHAPWLVEIGGPVVFVAVAGFLGYRWWRDRRPPTAALLFVGCFSMFWQEFYADWGAYLFYNPDLHLLPWHHTALTTPNKPWYVLAGYGWFYAGALPGLLWLFRRLRRTRPTWPYWPTLLVSTIVPFYLWNLITADGVSFLTNWYEYLHPIGPAIHTSKGGLPLLYPAFPFVLFAPMVIGSLDRVCRGGRTWFEALFRVPVTTAGPGGQLARIAAWVVGMNVLYSVALTIPLVVVRVLFLHENPYVP